ncbi:DUF6923 family protein [Kitasatospora phosalacinea]|uniref:DUF6923 family protein n=1 Tax=Kitasatospora phosalacinea TaxID=2065 RepID=A0ABW6GM03_9ACTN
MGRRWWIGLVVAGGLGAAALPWGPQSATAAAGDPFPAGPGLVFVAQGPARGEPSTLYEAVQGPGAITFAKQGTAAFGYNAVGYRTADHYLYGVNDNGALVRIGQGGAATNLGQVGLPASQFNYNQGTFGDGPTADTLYVRLATADRNLYAVNVATRTTTRITLSAQVPNLSDFVWASGYLWGVYGEGGRVYRIDPATGEVLSVAAPKLPANPYGAQWVYGNGNIGISNNVTGTVYQLRLVDPASATPSAVIVSATKGPANTQNDGAAYPGETTDLAIAKTGPAQWNPGDTLTYTLTVTNRGPGASSGYVVTDTLPDALSGTATTSSGCAVATDDGGHRVLQCSGGPLAPGQSATLTVTGTAPATAGTDCAADGISNTAQVLGNEADPNLTDNASSSTACPAGLPAPSFTVAKAASIEAPDFTGPGGRVTYTVTVTNTGTLAYTDEAPASFTDNLANVLDDAVLDPASLTGGLRATAEGVAWSGPLDVGETRAFTYGVVVGAPGTGDHVLRNAVVPGGTGSCADVCQRTTPVAEFTLRKSARPATATPGEKVVYTLTVTNTGAVPFGTGTGTAPAARVTDDLSGVLDDADYAGDASNGGTLTGTTLAWDLQLPVGATTTLTYSATVRPGTASGAALTNAAVPGPYGTCTADADCATSTPVTARAFTVAKTASTATARPGDRVTYTVTVTNTGTTDFTAEAPAAFTDDLSAVLDDAAYDGDATNGATVTGTTLNWSGPLAAGAHTAVSYSVTVNDPGPGTGTGDLTLLNTVAPGASGTCTDAAACATETTVTTPSPSPSPSPSPTGNVGPSPSPSPTTAGPSPSGSPTGSTAPSPSPTTAGPSPSASASSSTPAPAPTPTDTGGTGGTGGNGNLPPTGTDGAAPAAAAAGAALLAGTALLWWRRRNRPRHH